MQRTASKSLIYSSCPRSPITLNSKYIIPNSPAYWHQLLIPITQNSQFIILNSPAYWHQLLIPITLNSKFIILNSPAYWHQLLIPITLNSKSIIPNSPTALFSEVAPQAGAEHHEVSVFVVDILDGGLHCQDSVHLPSPRSLHGVFRPLKESGVLARESAFV